MRGEESPIIIFHLNSLQTATAIAIAARVSMLAPFLISSENAMQHPYDLKRL